jgi:hypothetical protein
MPHVGAIVVRTAGKKGGEVSKATKKISIIS